MSNLVVYGLTASTYVRTVRLLLAEIGADYTLQSVNIFNGDLEQLRFITVE